MKIKNLAIASGFLGTLALIACGSSKSNKSEDAKKPSPSASASPDPSSSKAPVTAEVKGQVGSKVSTSDGSTPGTKLSESAISIIASQLGAGIADAFLNQADASAADFALPMVEVNKNVGLYRITTPNGENGVNFPSAIKAESGSYEARYLAVTPSGEILKVQTIVGDETATKGIVFAKYPANEVTVADGKVKRTLNPPFTAVKVVVADFLTMPGQFVRLTGSHALLSQLDAVLKSKGMTAKLSSGTSIETFLSSPDRLAVLEALVNNSGALVKLLEAKGLKGVTLVDDWAVNGNVFVRSQPGSPRAGFLQILPSKATVDIASMIQGIRTQTLKIDEVNQSIVNSL